MIKSLHDGVLHRRSPRVMALYLILTDSTHVADAAAMRQEPGPGVEPPSTVN